MSLASSVLESVSRASVDGSVNLNEDLAPDIEHRRSGSFISHRNSFDGDSSFLSASAFFHNNANDDQLASEFSPLGPNLIFELTVGSDTARQKRGRAPKSSVSLNGGAVTVYSLRSPTVRDIPQVQLLKLEEKVAPDQLTPWMAEAAEYKSFENSYKNLTEDTLHRFQESLGNVLQEDIEDVVPAVYLDRNFRLDDPRVFEKVIEDCKIVPDDEGEVHIANNTELQDKLLHYLDVVEVKLIKEISKLSDSFFSTLGDIEEVSQQSKACIDSFHGIMHKLEQLEVDEAQVGLQILDKLTERRNVQHLELALLQVQYVVAFFDLAKRSFGNGINNKCLKEIIAVEALIHGVESPAAIEFPQYPTFEFPLVDLSHIPALQSLRTELYDLKSQCSRGYIDDFADLLQADLRAHYTGVPVEETLDRIYASINRKYAALPTNKSYQTVDPALKDKLREYVTNLLLSGHIVDAFQTYQNKFIAEIKDIIKTNLPTKDSNALSRALPMPDTQPQNSLSTNIRNLLPQEFYEMLALTYATLSECLRRLTVHQKLLLDLALTATSEDVMALDITVAINKAIELTQIRLTKVINVRLEQTADLALPFYLRLYSLLLAYLQECEFINPGYVASGPGSSLNDWVKNHVGYFVHRFHSNTIKRLASETDKEIWKEVADEDALGAGQQLLRELVDYAESKSSGDAWLDVLDLHSTKETAPAAAEPTERLQINGDAYLVPGLALSILKSARDYALIAKVFPSKASLVVLNVLSLFKLVNSKTSQAVLNAGATRTAGLKHITTKHIALCIQFIGFEAAFLTSYQHIYDNVKVVTPPQAPVEELTFAKIIGYYHDHDTELCSKLVSIMYERTVLHCQTIQQTDWLQPLTHPQQCHPYMETLVKETLTVAKVLGKYLPQAKCTMILSQIFDNYKKLIVECCCTQLAQFKDFNEKHLLLKDVDYFRVKLCELPGYGNSGQVIWENINSLPTIEDAKMEEIMRNNASSEAGANNS